MKFGQKSEKNHLFGHKNENISKNCGPILKNSTPIVFFLNSAYNTQFLKKSVQNWKKSFVFEVPPLSNSVHIDWIDPEHNNASYFGAMKMINANSDRILTY